jgi:hypothetical protein
MGAAGLAVHAAVNPMVTPAVGNLPDDRERISVLLPLRNEAHRVAPCLHAARAAVAGHGNAELLVLDDGSSDGTAELVGEICGEAAVVIAGSPLPAGWLGKPHACQQLLTAADPLSTALVYLDADVVLAPDALVRTVEMLRDQRWAMVCPYPRQVVGGIAERLVQPLLQWSWLSFLPLALAARSSRPSLGAANGQLMALDRKTLENAGGFDGVKAAVLDDLALLRAVKAVGGHGGVADGTGLASCRMYSGWADLRDGYSKSLWAAFGSPAGAFAANLLQMLLFVLPPVAALHPRTRRLGLIGYAAGVSGRVVTARRTGGRTFPDPLAHPVSVSLLGWLTARSWLLHRRGTLSWKGRLL